ncbi:MAG: DNA mismatch repair protein MutS [Planctomycetes bacterium]|nr:DNA mismatch repair protein MutS [Planctomycetota bacterium]
MIPNAVARAVSRCSIGSQTFLGVRVPRVAIFPAMTRKGEDSPAMRQYRELKDQHAGALLLYQMGDFYETFFADAKQLANTLGITLTTRGDDQAGNPIAMAGFPLRALDQHLPRLLEAGLRVVICEQVEDPAEAKGLVKRDVTRVITPGTVLEETLLDARKPSIIACWLPPKGKSGGGLAWAELSTGRFQCCPAVEGDFAPALARLEPAELLLPEKLWAEQRERILALRNETAASLTAAPDFSFDGKRAVAELQRHLGVKTLRGFGFEDEKGPELAAAGALLAYIAENQRGNIRHIRSLERFDPRQVMALDRATLDALEVTHTLRENRRAGSLLDSLDRTATAMGAREVRSWLTAPLTDPRKVNARHAAVDELVHTPRRLNLLREAMGGLPDLERIAGKLGSARANPRDLAGLRLALRRLPLVRGALAGAESALLSYASESLDALADLRELLESRLADEPPANLKDGGVIRQGVNAELDELRALGREGSGWMSRYQATEAERTGIASLKVGFNSVFGYYIEVTHAQAGKAPANYIRKQTLKGAERYITPELKEYESKILNAEKRIHALESQLFSDIREELTAHAARLLAAARLTALVDVLAGLAAVAHERGWVRPVIDDSRELRVLGARHAVLESTLEAGKCVPNDITLEAGVTMAVVTGPNMAGKSTYVRTVALCVLLAQAGSFVPAREARIGVVDRIFTRLGSADDIGQGQSTFMVEMAETANILNHATNRSLIVLDEVGRGTSTFDGVSIAWAVSEYLLREVKARTFFATHYHELTQLALQFSGVKNLNVVVREWNDELIFLHQIAEGGADRSYGIHVAKLAGIPGDIVSRARAILAMLEADSPVLSGKALKGQPAGPNLRRPRQSQLSLFTVSENRALKALDDLDTSAFTPEQALAELLRLKDIARE